MKLIRYGNFGSEKPAVQEGDTRIDVSEFVGEYDESRFANNGPNELARWLRANRCSAKQVPTQARLRSPIARTCKIVCVGLNFHDQAAESKMPSPTEPVLFMKSTTSLFGPNGNLVLPRNATKVDWEVELAVVIAKKASYVTRETALPYVAGFALPNDYFQRSFQLELFPFYRFSRDCD